MKLLVLAQTPPPVHGQSLMVRAMVEGLPRLGVDVRHVPVVLSRSHDEIGRWKPRKALATVRAGLAARSLARRVSFDALYYVPAPGKRGALWRDLIILSLVRPTIPRLVLHWHASGLGEWIGTARAWERSLAQRVLGAADLSIVLTSNLAADASVFKPRQIQVVSNGIPDPGESAPRLPSSPFEILFLGSGSRTKGLLDTAEAVALLSKQRPNEFRLTFAGAFATLADEMNFARIEETAKGAIRRLGIVDEAQKHAILSKTDLFCFPTYYPNEGQPLTLIEAMAHDVRIVTTRWRGIPEMLPNENVWFVEPRQPLQLATAIEAAARSPSPNGALRGLFLKSFTLKCHLSALKDALLLLGSQ